VNKTILSTADVARSFSVTETTVKRWANDGTLKCMKTPGGHRKFEMKSVVDFSQSLGFEPSGTLTLTKEDALAQKIQVAILSRDFRALKEAFLSKALSPDMQDLFIFFSYLYQHRIQLWELYDMIIAPAMQEMGERWQQGELTISQEHRASYETLEALAKLQTQIHLKPNNGYSVLLACPGEEQHEIGLRCASYLFESEGWNTHYLGCRVPNESLVGAARELRPTSVCISLTNLSSRKVELEELRELLSTLKKLKTNIVVGGRAVCGLKPFLSAHASTFCSVRELVAFIAQCEEDAKKN
jgi:methanogenic corrinoid protein MtbC1